MRIRDGLYHVEVFWDNVFQDEMLKTLNNSKYFILSNHCKQQIDIKIKNHSLR